MSTPFFTLLRRAPEGVQNCFDEAARRLDTDALNRYLGFASSGEAVLARFFAAVWCRSNDDFNFDVLDVGALDRAQRQIISEWVLNPAWS